MAVQVGAPFTPAVTDPGVTLTSFAGGSVEMLEFELIAVGGAIGSVRGAVTVDGEFLVYIPGAPAFVNAPFIEGFPEGLAAGMPMLVVMDDVFTPAQAKLDAARARWNAVGPPMDYNMELRTLCFCGYPVLGADYVALEVRGGVPVGGETVREGTPLPSDQLEFFRTIDDLFEAIQSAIDNRAASLEVEYDPVLGYPTSISIDQIALAVDDEVSYVVEGLAVLP